jgi:hypothetical protein
MAWRLWDSRRPAFLVWALLIPLLAACNLLANPETNDTTVQISGAPVVRLASPLPNSTFLEGVSVNIQAQITNAGPDINRVEVLVDNAIIATLTSPNTTGAAAFSVTQSWLAAGAGQHVIAVTAFRADGSSSAPVSANLNVVAQGAPLQPASATPVTGSPAQPTSGAGVQVTTPPQATTPPQQPTTPPQPTAVPPTNTPSVPIATFNQGANVRSGPSTLFNPPIGSFAAGATADILGVTPAGDWYKIRYYNGDGWVFSQLITVSGDTSRIPVDAGPAIPTLTPVPPTPVPVTATPALNVNLVVGNITFNPATPNCAQTFNIFVDIANFGSNANATSGTISVTDTRVSDGSVQQTTVGSFGIIQPGQTVNVGPIPLTVSTYFAEEHRITIVVDSGGQVSETNEGDNTGTKSYTLSKASC